MSEGIGIEAIIIFAAVVGNVAIGSAVFLRDIKDRVGRIFFLFTLVLSLTMLAGYFSVVPLNRVDLQVYVMRIEMAFAYLTTILLVTFVKHFPQDMGFPGKRLFSVLLLSSVVFFVLSLLTNLVARGVTIRPNELVYYPGPLDSFYALGLFINLCVGAITLLKKRSNLDGLAKLQVEYLILAVSLPSLIVSIGYLLLLRIISAYYPMATSLVHVIPLLSYSSTFLFTLVSGYAIMRYQLFGIRVVLARLVFWGGISSFLFSLYLVTQFIEEYVLPQKPNLPEQAIFYAVFSISAALLLSVFEKGITRLVSSKLMKYSLDCEGVEREFIVSISKLNELGSTINCLHEIICNCFEPNKQCLFVTKEGKFANNYLTDYVDFSEDDIRTLESEQILNLLLNSVKFNSTVAMTEVNPGVMPDELYKTMKILGIELIVPISLRELSGAYLIGPRKNGHRYSNEEINLIQRLVFQAVVTVSRVV